MAHVCVLFLACLFLVSASDKQVTDPSNQQSSCAVRKALNKATISTVTSKATVSAVSSKAGVSTVPSFFPSKKELEAKMRALAEKQVYSAICVLIANYRWMLILSSGSLLCEGLTRKRTRTCKHA